MNNKPTRSNAVQVETYEVNEVTPDGVDTLDADSIAMIERLGLNGQRSLVSKPSDAAAATVMPYQQMTAEEFAVYRLLFPQRDPVAEYSAGPIPLRVLQVIAFAKEAGWFERLEIWHKSTGSAKDDPILVGCAPRNQRTWNEPRFLLARWGDALLPFSKLTEQAEVIARSQIRNALAVMRRAVESAAAALEHEDAGAVVRWAANGLPTCMQTEPPR